MTGCALPRYGVLLGVRAPTEPAEASIVFAALAALAGYRADGEPMPGAPDVGRPASLREIAAELGVHVGAARRGVAHLIACGAASREASGIRLMPATLAERWSRPWQRLRLVAGVRALGLRAEALVLAAAVAAATHGRADGQWRMGLVRLGGALGMPRRTVQRAIATAADAGAIRRWIAPVGRGLLVLAPGTPEIDTRSAPEHDARSAPEHDDAATKNPPIALASPSERRVPAPVPSRSGAASRRVPAPLASRNGARYSGRTEYPDSPDALPRAEGETRPAAEAAPIPVAPKLPPPPARRPMPFLQRPALSGKATLEDWLVQLVKRGVERLRGPDVAALLRRLDPEDAPVTAQLIRERLRFGDRAAAWCPDPERLARWLARVQGMFGVRNLGAYLRRAVERGGDHGTVLGSATRNRYGRATEDWRDFAGATEKSIEGPRQAEVARIVAGTAATLAVVDEAARERLRKELRRMLDASRTVAARQVLLRLVGATRTPEAIARAVGDVCTVEVAHQLLRGVA